MFLIEKFKNYPLKCFTLGYVFGACADYFTLNLIKGKISFGVCYFGTLGILSDMTILYNNKKKQI